MLHRQVIELQSQLDEYAMLQLGHIALQCPSLANKLTCVAQLSSLRLHGNKLTGALPDTWANLTSVSPLELTELT